MRPSLQDSRANRTRGSPNIVPIYHGMDNSAQDISGNCHISSDRFCSREEFTAQWAVEQTAEKRARRQRILFSPLGFPAPNQSPGRSLQGAFHTPGQSHSFEGPSVSGGRVCSGAGLLTLLPSSQLAEPLLDPVASSEHCPRVSGGSVWAVTVIHAESGDRPIHLKIILKDPYAAESALVSRIQQIAVPLGPNFRAHDGA